jgi:hypothetical protein
MPVLPETGSAPAGYERISSEKGDPGERAYAIACGDGKRVTVFLDGVEQKYPITADAREGWVLRDVATPDGNLAWNRVTGEIYREVVHGVVRIEIA